MHNAYWSGSKEMAWKHKNKQSFHAVFASAIQNARTSNFLCSNSENYCCDNSKQCSGSVGEGEE